ncbi:MAG TPA: pyrroline-5-carboxylate reductase [Cyclobacteriaceae bacterium]|nr:pyrroline-5-carboxylate reductase [Cyclobacteriaceae bacterium]
MENKIAILGGGNLGVAIAKGLVQGRTSSEGDILITRRNTQKLEELKNAGFNVMSDNIEAVKQARIIILCVQPKQLGDLLEQIKSKLIPESHLLVSTITGVTTAEIISLVDPRIPVVRAMPNTAIAIGQSMTCICATNASPDQIQEVEVLFSPLGKTLRIEERLMKAATVLAASGIAFFMRYLRAATQGGIQLGFDAEEAQLIAVQTALGAASLISEGDSHPELEIDKVTTPEGCTIAGLNEMEHQGLSSALIKGIITSFEKINNIRK